MCYCAQLLLHKYPQRGSPYVAAFLPHPGLHTSPASSSVSPGAKENIQWTINSLTHESIAVPSALSWPAVVPEHVWVEEVFAAEPLVSEWGWKSTHSTVNGEWSLGSYLWTSGSSWRNLLNISTFPTCLLLSLLSKLPDNKMVKSGHSGHEFQGQRNVLEANTKTG